jgi:hypothetical protein
LVAPEPPGEEEERRRKAKDDARVMDEDQDYAYLFLVPFDPHAEPGTVPEPTQVTRGPRTVLAFDWFPAANRIAFSHRPMPEWEHWQETTLAVVEAPDFLPGRQEIASPEPGSGQRSAVEGIDRAVEDVALVQDWTAKPLVSPDGAWIACHTTAAPGKWALAGRIMLYRPSGGPGQPLAPTPDGKCDLVGWSPDSRALYVLEQTGVTTQLWALPASGAPGSPVTASTLLKSAAATCAARPNGVVAFVGQDFEQPNAVYLCDPASGEISLVAQPALPASWPREPLPHAEVIRWRAADGRAIEGIVVYPLHYREGQRVPLVVEVHGGPPGVYTRGYLASPERLADTVALAARGYALLRANPRGSTG